jgi:hypothetical protein
MCRHLEHAKPRLTPDRENGPLPVTAEQWRAFLAEYSDWYLSKEPAHWNNLTEEQRRTRWLGRLDAYRKAGGLEVDGEDDIFLHALSLAQGEDTILLDTRSVSAEGEYDAYLFAVKYGALPEPCTSFSEVIAEGRAEIEECRP